MQLDHYKVAFEHDGQAQIAHLALQQILTVVVGLIYPNAEHTEVLDATPTPESARAFLDATLARKVVETFLENKRLENPNVAIGAWWEFYKTRRIDDRQVEVTFTLDTVQFPEMSPSPPEPPILAHPSTHVHLVVREL